MKIRQIRCTYKFPLYRSKRDIHLHNQIDTAGQIWNHCIALQRRYYRLTNKYISKYTLQKHIAKLQNTTHLHWKSLGSQAVQDVIDRVDKGYKDFFKYCKEGGVKVGRPTFKKVKKYKSYTLKQVGWKLLGGNKIRIHKKNYKFVKHREIKDVIKTVTVKRDNINRLWICFSVIEDIDVLDEASTGKIGGFDFGLKIFLTNDDGEQVIMPQYLKSSLVILAKRDRELSSKEKGSNNRRKASHTRSKVHNKVTNQRRDVHFKLAHTLCDVYDVMIFEDLNIAWMKRLWGRMISDYGFAQFVAILQHIATKRGKRLLFIGRWEPTSKRCSNCDYRQKLTLADRRFDCPMCGLNLDRDHNAAKNILRVGATTHGLEIVSRA